MKDKLEQYIVGMEAQYEYAKRQMAMIDGALQFARQLIEDLTNEEGEAENLPQSEQEDS